MEDKQLRELLNKYSEGALNPEEKAILESWYVMQASNSNLDLSDKEIDLNLKKIGKNLPLKYNAVRISLWSGIISAAAILIIISSGIYFYSANIDKTLGEYAGTDIRREIAPGGNKAILTLADGSKISLTDASNGDIARQAGIRITKTADGQLIYTILDAASEPSNPVYNTIETPRGGQYQVILPDGSKVWLNAASSLKYPPSFASQKERRIELNGEAYFEIAKDKLHPFIVNTNKQEIKVLGTHFNVNAYSDEPQIKTTLLEGSVLVYKSDTDFPSEGGKVMLIPGQQSVFDGNSIKINSVDPEDVVAWKNGYFRFDDESLESIMRKISRWYDVDITWRDESVKSESFAAVSTRFANVSSLLKMIEQTGDVKFNIEDGKIIVSKKK